MHSDWVKRIMAVRPKIAPFATFSAFFLIIVSDPASMDGEAPFVLPIYRAKNC
jgi:hypothetical protein